jgi:hypothetical protein
MFQKPADYEGVEKESEDSTEGRFFELEKVLERGLRMFYEVGKVLTTIRDEKLYQEHGYSGFRQYCEQRWGLKKSHVYRVIKAAEVFENLMSWLNPSPIGDTYPGEILPTNEAQIRPLTKFDPERQREVWSQAVKSAPQGKITAEHIEKVAQQSDRQYQPCENPPCSPAPQTGDCVEINLCQSNDSELNPHHRELAVVEEVTEYSVIVRVWGKLLPPLFPEEVKPAPRHKKVSINTQVIVKVMAMGYESIHEAIEDLLNKGMRVSIG